MLKILKEYMDNISGEGVKEGRGEGGYRSSPPSPQEGRGGEGVSVKSSTTPSLFFIFPIDNSPF